MAVAVIVGILFATFLTLVLVPVMYSLVDDFTAFFDRHFRHQDGLGEPVAVEGVEDLIVGEPVSEGADAPSSGTRETAGVRRQDGGLLSPGLVPRPETS